MANNGSYGEREIAVNTSTQRKKGYLETEAKYLHTGNHRVIEGELDMGLASINPTNSN